MEYGPGGRFEKSYLDVMIVYPHAPSNGNQGLAAIFVKHENYVRLQKQLS